MKFKLFFLVLVLCFSQPQASASETRSKFEKYLVVADQDRYAQALTMIQALSVGSPKDDLYLAEKARIYMNLNQLDKALADSSSAVAINPKNTNALRTRSYCHLMQRNYAKGIADLNLLVKISEPEPVNMWPRSDNENLARAYALTGQKDLAMKLRPLCMLDQLTEQAVIAREGAGLQKAIKLTGQVLAKNPKHLNALGFTGLCYNNLTQFKESIEFLNRALALRPNNTPLLYLRADGYRETRQYEKAIADLTKIISLKPRLVMFKYAAHTGRLRDKFTHLDVDPVNMADIYFLRAACYDNLKKTELALSDYNKVLELDPKEYRAANGSGNAYFSKKKFNEAIKFYTQALTINPKFWEAYAVRSRAYEQIGDLDKAASDISVILTKNPHDAGAYGLRGNIYKRAKKYDLAVADFSKMIELSPTDDEGFGERASVYALMGQYGRAIKDYDKALSLSVEDKEFLAKAKSEVLKKMGTTKPPVK